jgi:NAD(P)-dependent dehydrogenase (short-subunit alcohol dehydrogenase family)
MIAAAEFDVSGRTLVDLMDMTGRTAVVTGGSRGIGLSIVRRLLEMGASVAIADIDIEGANSAAADLRAAGADVHALELDVRDPASVRRVCDAVEAQFARLDVWVNNAGVYPPKPFLEITSDDWHGVMETNLTGVFNCSSEAAHRMTAAATKGVIVNIGSAASFRSVRAGLAHYTASKHAVEGLTKSMARELGPFGIRVMGVAPTVIETEGLAEQRRLHPTKEDPYAQVVERLPLGRAGRPDDVARAVAFCVSDLAIFITGCTLPVDGGFQAT